MQAFTSDKTPTPERAGTGVPKALVASSQNETKGGLVREGEAKFLHSFSVTR